MAGSTAYVADGPAGLQVFDILIPAAPAIAGSQDTPGNAVDVAVAGNYAYVADGNEGLQVIDISDPASPAIVGSQGALVLAQGVAVAGNHAYVSDGADFGHYRTGLQVIDISNPAVPALVGSQDTPGFARGVAMAGSTAYVADGTWGLQVIDISNPAAPAIVGSRDTPGDAWSVTVAGVYAYIADGSAGLQVFVGSRDTPGFALGVAVSPAGGHPCVADGGPGLHILPPQCGAAVATPEPNPAPSLTALGAVFPNPSRQRHLIEVLVAPGQPAGALRIHDVTGRLVWRLDLSGLSSGSHFVKWDGRSLDGRPLPASVYIVELESEAGTATRKIARVR